MVNQAPRLVVMVPISDDAILEGNIATRDELASKVCGLGLDARWEPGPNDSLPAWRRLARGGLEVVPIPGGHLDALDPPAVDVVAATLSAVLDMQRDRVAAVGRA